MEIYKSIMDLPIYNFDQINKTGDFTYLVKSGKIDDGIDLSKIWETIYNEYINEFGISDTLKMWIAYMNEYMVLAKEAYVDGQKWKLTLAKVKEQQAELLFKNDNNYTLGYIAANISKYMAFRVNIKDVSVYEFYNYIKLNNGK